MYFNATVRTGATEQRATFNLKMHQKLQLAAGLPARTRCVNFKLTDLQCSQI